MGQWVGSGHITKNQINLDLMKIIKFCLKFYDLLRHLHIVLGGEVPRLNHGIIFFPIQNT